MTTAIAEMTTHQGEEGFEEEAEAHPEAEFCFHHPTDLRNSNSKPRTPTMETQRSLNASYKPARFTCK